MAVIYVTHILRCVTVAVAVTGSICIVLTRNVEAVRPVIGKPCEPLSESGCMAVSKNILVGYQPPNREYSLSSFLDGSNFIIRNEVINHAAHYIGLVCTNDRARRLPILVGERERKVGGGWNWQNFSFDSDAHLTSWSIAGIHQMGLAFKFEIGLPFPALLKDWGANDYREVCPHHGLIALFDRVGNAFHSRCGTRCFVNVALHGFGLLSSSLDGLSQFVGLITENEQLQGSNERKYRSQFDKISIICRFFFAVFLGLSGFFISFRGWFYFNNQRRTCGSTLICLGTLLGALGFLILWL
jgi:hypothetical protein